MSLIYSFFMDQKKKAEREVTEVRNVVETVAKVPIQSHVRSLVLEVMASDPNTDEDVEIPYIKYDFAV